jgi:predicted DNA-binding transcriptional regulator AlpA
MRKENSAPAPAVTVPQQVSENSYEPLLTREEVARRLRQKPETIYSLTRRRCLNPLPAIRIGKSLVFRWSQIEQWLATQGRAA